MMFMPLFLNKKFKFDDMSLEEAKCLIEEEEKRLSKLRHAYELIEKDNARIYKTKLIEQGFSKEIGWRRARKFKEFDYKIHQDPTNNQIYLVKPLDFDTLFPNGEESCS